MSDKLKQLKKEIEKQIKQKIDTPDRDRHLTYARAVFCKVARSMKDERGFPIPFRVIGEHLNRDHATVMHSIKVVFPFAVKEDEFKYMYKALKTSYVFDDNDIEEEEYSKVSERIKNLIEDNRRLKSKIDVISKGMDDFIPLFEDLSFDELKEVYDKMSIMVKAIKSRVYL
jgi:hypothetical protein